MLAPNGQGGGRAWTTFYHAEDCCHKNGRGRNHLQKVTHALDEEGEVCHLVCKYRVSR